MMKHLKQLTFLALALVVATATACDKKETAPKAAEETKTEAKKEEAKAEPKAEEKKEEAAEAKADDGTQWVVADTYGVKFRVPQDWKVAKSADALSATSPDDKITIILVGTESEGVFESAMSSISKQVNLKELKTEKSEMTVINGLAGFHGRGSAVLENEEGGQDIQFLGYALKLAADKGVAVMLFSEAEMYEARKEELEGIAKTLQKG